MSHRPLQTAPLHDLTQANGEDIYEHPEWFGYSETDYFRESVRVFRSVRNDPDALVTIYRSAPSLETIRHGDWVALAESYARMHGMRPDWCGPDWPVYVAQVPAHTIWWDGSDVNEFGYFGEEISADLLPNQNVSGKVT